MKYGCLWMFNESIFQKYYTYVSLARCNIEKNIILESFLVHARNLVYFLQDEKDSRDIRRSDFGGAEININLLQGNTIDEIDKYLSHLTKRRISSKKPKWECNKIREEINKRIKEFLEQLPQEVFPTPKGRRKSDFEVLLK